MQDNDNAETINETSQSEKRSGSKSWIRRKSALIIGGIALLVVVVAVGILTKRIALALLPGTKATVITEICSDSDIAKFNTLIRNDYDSLGILMKDIETRPNYKNDTSCVFMEYRYFYGELQYSKAVEMANRYKELINSGSYSNSKISIDQSISTLDRTLEVIRTLPDGQDRTSSDGDE